MKTRKQRTFWGIAEVIGIALLAGLIFTACPMEDENHKLAFIDIVGATQLFVTDGSGGRSANGRAVEETRRFFKITEDGYVQEVKYYDENGNEIRTDYDIPRSIHNVNDNYVLVGFFYTESDPTAWVGYRSYHPVYLVRKTDGAVFLLEEQKSFSTDEIVQCDSLENIYYYYDQVGLTKVNTSNPDRLTKVVWIEDFPYGNEWIVNPSGHILYIKPPIARIKKSNGGLVNLPDAHNPNFWIDFDGNIKYYPNGDKIYSVNIDSDFQDTITSIDVSFYKFSLVRSITIKLDDRVIIIDGNTVYEVENPDNDPRTYTIGEINVKCRTYSNDYCYFSGNNSSSQPVLLRLDPKTEEVTTLLQPNQYDISSMSVDKKNVITFNGLRMADGKKVMAQVSANGEVSLLDVAADAEITILVRIQ